MGNLEKEPIVVDTGIENLAKLYPKQYVALEEVEEQPGIGITEGIVIAHGPEKQPIVNQLADFRKDNPGKKTAFFYTGRHARKPGKDIIMQINHHT